MGFKVVAMVLLLVVILSGDSLFAEKGGVDFDAKPRVSGQAKTLIELFPDNQNIPPVFKAMSGMSKKVFKIAETGQEVEVLPEEVGGKAYYTFKPNELFYDKIRCNADGGVWNFCTYYEFYPSYGGHRHTENIPPYTDWNNNLAPSPRCFSSLPVNTDIFVYYKAPAFATKAEHVTSGWGDCGGELYHTIDIKISGLMPLPPAYQDSLHAGVTYYNLINNPPYSGYHSANHFGREQTINLLKQIAWNYYFEFPKSEVLNINDISLKWGGLFDVDANWQSGPNGHNRHRYGRQADLRIWSIPVENRKRFEEISCNLGVLAEIHGKNDETLSPSERDIWRKTDFKLLSPWNNLSPDELDARTPHYHLIFPKFDTEADNPPDQFPTGCPPSK